MTNIAEKTKITPYGHIAFDFFESRLEDICIPRIGVQTGPFGSLLHKKDYVESGTPIITVEHLGENRIVHENTPFVSHKDRIRLEKFSLKPGDIVFSRVGSVDRRSLVRKTEDGWLFSGRCLRVRANQEIVDPIYLSYFFGLNSFKEYIRSIAVGATMPSLNTRILSEVPIYYPPLPEQRAIARILDTFDDKIELNRRMNATLEAMARAIFKSWFVDFDPVWAKMEGEEPTGMDAKTAALFPDEFEEVDGREVPAGWEVSTIGFVLELAYGKALKESERLPGQIPVYGSNGQIGWHDEPLVEGPGVIVGRKGNPGTVVWSHTDFFPIDTTFYVTPKMQSMSLSYLYHELMLQNLLSLGSDSAVPGLNRNIAYMNSIVIPPDEVIKRFDTAVMPLFNLIYLNAMQSRTLAALRDTLLPKLISGEIRVPDAMLEAVES